MSSEGAFTKGQGWNSNPVLAAAVAQLADRGVGDDDLPATIEQAAATLGEAVRAVCVIALRASKADERCLVIMGLHHANVEIAHDLEPLIGTSIPASAFLGKAFLEGEVTMARTIDAPNLRANGSAFADLAQRWGLTSLMAAPLAARTGRLGAIGFARLGRDDKFTNESFDFMLAAANVAALVVEDGALLEVLGTLRGGGALQLEWSPSGEPAVREGTSQGSEPLTDREREVLALIALGHTNREAADQLVLSVRTVEWHRARLQWKLRASNRADLVKAARALGVRYGR
jgi:DNA-binding CsgD family transcriptional regulator